MLSKHAAKGVKSGVAQGIRERRLPQRNITHGGAHKAFNGPGPYSFDYLLGVNNYVSSNFDVIFIDYDVEEAEIQRFLNEGKTVICYVNVVSKSIPKVD